MRHGLRTTARRGASAVLVLGMSGAAGVARAEPTSEERAAATVLFREARGLMDKGDKEDVAAACRRFEESQRLDPLPGTLLNMAVCHEREGRTATAWVELRDAEALARRDGRQDRVTLAEEHMKALEPRLCTVRIVVGARADVPSLSVTLDGSELARPAWNTPLPVDPGTHVVGAAAPSSKPFSARVDATREGETQTVTIDALEAAPPPAPAAEPPVLPAPAPAPPTVSSPAPELAPPAARESTGLSSRRVSALALGGAAIAGLGVGTYFGIDAITKHADSNRGCPANQCTVQGAVANSESQTSADRSTVTFAVSLVALAAATYLWLSGGDAAASRSAILVVPIVRGDGGGVSLARTF